MQSEAWNGDDTGPRRGAGAWQAAATERCPARKGGSLLAGDGHGAGLLLLLPRRAGP